MSTKERTYRSALKKLVQMVDNQEEKIPRMLLQTFYDDFKAYTSKVYSPETVTVQDRGFMWFGTRQGFCRYDGDAKVVHKGNELDSTSISDNIIIALVEDDKNTTRMQLWDSLFTDSLLTFS